MSEFMPVAPVRPVAGYIGGKRQLAKRLVEAISRMPHETYAEPFVGMGGVFFRRSTMPRAEVINDRNGDVVTLFRILQRHYPQFMDTLRFQVTSRREFERLKASDPATLTDLERAARFLYLQRLAFGGKVSGQNFGVSVGMPARFNITKLAPMLEEVHERLAGVVIENLDWQDFIDRYDRPGTLFYLDPPYHGSEGDYGRQLFDRDQFEVMAERLGRLKGRFILSINDVPEIRETFAAFAMEQADLTYTIAGGDKTQRVTELIITGP
jgi:DNA adenine methylase